MINLLKSKFFLFQRCIALEYENLAFKTGTKEGLEKGDKFEVLEKYLEPETGKIGLIDKKESVNLYNTYCN